MCALMLTQDLKLIKMNLVSMKINLVSDLQELLAKHSIKFREYDSLFNWVNFNSANQLLSINFFS